jgi:hypothetical protein
MELKMKTRNDSSERKQKEKPERKNDHTNA